MQGEGCMDVCAGGTGCAVQARLVHMVVSFNTLGAKLWAELCYTALLLCCLVCET